MKPAEIADRREEIAAELRASGKAWQYAERHPERDHFRLWFRWKGTDTVVGVAAYHGDMITHRRYEALYGAHPAKCWWCYEPPPGVEVCTEEPEQWDGWRP